MKKRLMSKFLMGALVVLTMGVFSSCKDYDDDINANTKLIQNLQSQVSTLETAKNSLQSDLSTANSAIAALQNSITATDSELAQAKKDLQDAINAANGNIDANKTAIDAAQARIDAAEGKITSLVTQVATLETEVATINAKIAILDGLQKDVAALNAAIGTKVSQADFDAAIEALKNDVKAQNDALQPILADIAALQTLVATKADQTTVEAIQARLNEIYGDYLKKADKEALETAIALLGSRLDAVEGNINELTVSVKANTDAISVNAAAITALEQAVNQIEINYATIEYVDGKIQTLSDELSDEIAKRALKTELQALQTQIENALNNKADKTALQDAVDAINATIATLATKSELQSEVNAINSALGELSTAIQNLANSTYTKDETDDAIANAVATAQLQLQLQINDLSANYQNLHDALVVLEEVTLAQMNADLLAAIGVVDGKVDNLGNKVGGLETNLEILGDRVNDNYTTIMGIISGLATTSYVDDAIDELAGTMRGINTIVQQNLANIGGLDTRVGALEGELAGMASALNQLAAELGALNFDDIATSRALAPTATSGITALVNLLKTMAAKIDEVYDYLDAFGIDQQNQVDSKINGVYSFINTALAGVQEKIDNITLFITKNLTSLVFRPEVDVVGESTDVAYLYGFPVIRAILLQPQKVFTFKYTASTDKDVATGSGSVSKQFDIIAKYWLNPSSTDITKYKFGFDEVAGKNIITRGNTDTKKAGVGAKVLGVDNKGVLSVALTLNDGANVNNALTIDDGNGKAAWITTVALQAVRNDASVNSKDTVTSDYAIIVPAYYKDLLLAYNKYADQEHKEGNNLFHIRTAYDKLTEENATGVYSDSLEYNTSELVDLTKIDIHFNDGVADHGVMTHEDAEARGFNFKYTILTNADYFKYDDKAQTIAIKEDKKDINSVGKVANVRVELQADDKTFAYGYISIIITNLKKTVKVPIPELLLQCPGDFKSSITWAKLEELIKAEVGPTFSFDNYEIDLSKPLKKVNSAGKTVTPAALNASVLQKVENDLVWSFSEDAAKKLFYNNDNTPKDSKTYTVYVELTPKSGKPEVADVKLQIVLQGVIYPRGTYPLQFNGLDQRIHRYWFLKESTEHADNAADRYEVHANVDVYGQKQTVDDTKQADDDFLFDATAFFLKNEFRFQPATGFDWSETINNEAPMFFNSKIYDVRNGAADGTALTKKVVHSGASGAKYALYLDTPFALQLKATKQNADGSYKYSADDQVVVTLSSKTPAAGTKAIERNEIVKFEGKRVEDGTRDYARDLLNNAAHTALGAGETFTTHMVFADNGDLSCLPIALDGYRTFDIRYLRPLSANMNQPRIIQDAVDGGTYNTRIYLTDLAAFIDWRNYEFTASNGINYLYYYGVKKIKADFENAKTNLNGGDNLAYNPETHTMSKLTAADHATAANWPLITEVTGKLSFEPDNAAKTPADKLSRTTDFDTFKDVNCGYYLYQNNAGNVGTFQIYIPISIVYDWGETKPVNVLVTIEHTEGQNLEARVK